MMKGTIVRKRDEGYGFIKPEEGEKDVYFHASSIAEGTSFDDLSEGDVVTFDVEDGDRGPKAVNVGLGSGDSGASEAPADEPAQEDEAEELDWEDDRLDSFVTALKAAKYEKVSTLEVARQQTHLTTS